MKCGEERGLPSPFPFLQNFQLHPTESQTSLPLSLLSFTPPRPKLPCFICRILYCQHCGGEIIPPCHWETRTEDVAGCGSRSLFSNLAPQPLPKEYCTTARTVLGGTLIFASRFLLRPRPLFPRTVRPYAPLSRRISLSSLLFLGAEAKVDHPRLIGRENNREGEERKKAKEDIPLYTALFFS